MALQFNSFSTFLNNAGAAVQSSASALIDLTVGSVTRAILEAVSGVAMWLQWNTAQVLALTRFATSNGTDLDSAYADFGFTRLAAVSATGSVTFGRYTTTTSALVPIGGVVKTSDGTQSFAVYADPTNAAYSATLGGYVIAAGVASVTAPVQAINAGTQGNVAAGSISLAASALAGIDTITNGAAFTNGIDAESDAAFRTRFQVFIQTRTLGTLAAVGAAVLGVEQGLSSTIQENTPATGNFIVTVDDGSGSPSSGLLALVSAAVNLARPIGSTFSVAAPTKITATISLTITVAAGYTKANMLATVQTAVAAFINALPMGSPLPYSRIAQVVYDSQPGITNVTALLVNGATADLGGGAAQVVRAGICTVS